VSRPKQRARSPLDKELRRTALLEAARDLAIERGAREVTLAEVTSRVGLHASAVRRYFESREELLLELAEQGWSDWRAQLVGRLEEAQELTPEKLADAVAGSLEALPLFCDLLTHVVLSLEGAVRLERARSYKLSATTDYDAMAQAVVDTGSGLDHAGARTVLTAAMSMGAYLFQLSRPTATLRELYEQEPRWAHDALRFREQLAGLLTAVVRGAQEGSALSSANASEGHHEGV
jgi:AcrR family transcriptional regulator